MFKPNPKYLPLFFFLGILFSPSLAFAAMHTYTCADWSLQNSATCMSDVVLFDQTNTQSAANNGAGNVMFDTHAPSTWYVTATLTGGSGTNPHYFLAGDMGNSSVQTFAPGLNSEVSITNAGGNTFSYLILTNDSGGAGGSLSNICIDDDGVSCSATPPTPPSGGGGYPLASTTQVVDNPTQDLYQGMVLFMGAFFGIIWFFRKNR